jgi:nitroimidazol reductase NimA-like FMN-containing flavoprotein (pyridoxamine 5'-phosphate oxidase superfamily)
MGTPSAADRRDPHGILRMDDHECWRFLERHWLGRVALIHLDQPAVFPVTYVVDRGAIVFRTAPGTKLALAAIGAPAAFEVDEASKLLETGASVVVHGNLREVTDRAERARLGQLPLRTWAPGDRDHFVRVEARSVSGRRLGKPRTEDGLAADGG